jgi:hypothetical protein
MRTLEIPGHYEAQRYAQLYTLFGDQTARTYHITLYDYDSDAANPTLIEVAYNDTPARLDPDDRDEVCRPFSNLTDVAAYIAQCEGDE